MEKQINKQSSQASSSLRTTFLVIATAIITALLAGGGVFFWQRTIVENTKNELQSQIDVLKNQLMQLEARKDELPQQATKISPDNQIEEIKYEDLNNFDSPNSLVCISTFDLENREKEFVVNNQEEYQKLLDYKSLSLKCKNFVLPKIDFSQKTLLGKYTASGGCSVEFSRKVYRDDANKKIIYSIDVIGEGLCEKLGLSMNWILIPKVPSDHSVVFDVEVLADLP